MSRNGSGVYSLPAGNPVVNGTTISSAWANTTLNDMASAISNSVASDGQTPIVGSQNMGGFKHTNVGAATARTDYARASQVQDGAFNYAASAGGTGDNLVLTISPPITAYAGGMTIDFVASADNTTNMVVNVDGVGNKAILFGGLATPAGIVKNGRPYSLFYDGTAFNLSILSDNYLSPAAGTVTTASIADGAVTTPKLADAAVTAIKLAADSIHGQTAETTPALLDELLVWSSVATALRKIIPADLLSVINLLTADTAPDAAADYLMSYDTSASTVKKVLMKNVASEQIIASGNISTVGDTTFAVPTGTFKRLKLTVTGLNAGANYEPYVQFNADTGANYGWARWVTTVGASAGRGAVTTSGICLFSNGDLVRAAATNALSFEMDIANPGSGTSYKAAKIHPHWVERASDNAPEIGVGDGVWRSTSAITSIQILLRDTAGTSPSGLTVNATSGTWYLSAQT